jgi:excinuclease ABC subunit C
LQYHIHRCLGPCIGAADPAEYRQVIGQVCLFLEGKHEQIVSTLRRRMEEAAEALQFERAAHIRDQIRAVEKVTERQRVVDAAMKDQDVIAFARANGDACVEVFFVRGGKLIGREHFLLEGTKDEDAEQIMTSFVTQFYDSAAFVPPEILLQNEVAEAEVIESWLRDKRGGHKVAVSVPRRGKSKKLVDLVATNAGEVLAQMRAKWLADERKTSSALNELADYLDLQEPPARIECYDISNIQGTSSVGAMVVFENGQPANGAYRRFQIKTVDGPNDFASLQEVLRRRFKRAKESLAAAQEAQGVDDALVPLDPLDTATAGEIEETEAASAAPLDEKAASWARLPDLIIIDGGKGQLSSSMEVLRELDVNLPTVGLAKENEEIFLPENPVPIILPRDSQALFLVQRVRDETHRFAITFHRQKRGKSALKSSLDDLPGIGPARKKALLKHFGSPKRIREATVEELMEVDGISRGLAEKIRANL